LKAQAVVVSCEPLYKKQQVNDPCIPAAMKGAGARVARVVFLAAWATVRCDLPRVQGYLPIGSFDADDMGTHKVAFWRQQPDYLETLSHKNTKTGEHIFNSCMARDMTAQEVCNGRGSCAPWSKQNPATPVFFCRCDLGWAGPECSIKQKSQTAAWMLSCLLGFAGVDEYYLGNIIDCCFKVLGLCIGLMLVALGFNRVGYMFILGYWLFDIARIGSGAVRAHDAMVAADLPHWAFACFTIVYFAFIAFLMGVCKVYMKITERRRHACLSKFYCACDENGAPLMDGPKNYCGSYDPADKRTTEPWNYNGQYVPKQV